MNISTDDYESVVSQQSNSDEGKGSQKMVKFKKALSDSDSDDEFEPGQPLATPPGIALFEV